MGTLRIEFRKENDSLKASVAELEKQLAVFTALRDEEIRREVSQPYPIDDFTPTGSRRPPKPR